MPCWRLLLLACLVATALTTAPGPVATPAAATLQEPVDCTVRKCVALTYDDGPGLHTDRLLGILRRQRATATFFVVGEMVATRPAVARRTVRAGHEIAVHSWSHPRLDRLSAAGIRSELERTRDVIRRRTGARATLMRPPYGATNRTVVRVARDLGLRQVLWTDDTWNWRDRNVRVITRRAVRGARRNSIILMHDIHRTSVDAAPGIIRGLRRRGFTLVTVSELLGLVPLTKSEAGPVRTRAGTRCQAGRNESCTTGGS